MGSNPTADKKRIHVGNIGEETLQKYFSTARLAQLVERKALNLVVVGPSPTVCVFVGVLRLTFLFFSCVLYRANFGQKRPP